MPYVNRHPDGRIKDLFSNCQFEGQEFITPNGPEHQAWKHRPVRDLRAERKVRLVQAKTMDELKALIEEIL